VTPEGLGLQAISQRFVHFADEARGSSALYTHLSPKIAAADELLELLLVAPPAQRRANLLFAAVHDVLLEHGGHPVAAYYPSITESALPPDEATFDLFRDFCLSHHSRLCTTIARRHTQTNEVRRSAAFIPILQRLSASGPLALVEVGSSAGLNLLMDRYRYRYGNGPWVGPAGSPVAIRCAVRGEPPPVHVRLGEIAYRIGVDVRPLDVCNADDERWLMACVWPEQLDRLQLLRVALEVAKADPPPLIAGDALTVLEDVVAEIDEDMIICLINSATLSYFTDDECAAFVSMLDRIGGRRELHWLSLEGSALQAFGARLPFDQLFELRPTDRATDIFGLLGYASWEGTKREDHVLARVDMHGSWIEWLQAGTG
jgi:hypothetical protein